MNIAFFSVLRFTMPICLMGMLSACILPMEMRSRPPSGPRSVYRLPVDARNPVKIHLNQVGYDANALKRAIVESVSPKTAFDVVLAGTDTVLLSGVLTPILEFSEFGGGPYFYEADFTAVRESSQVVIRVGDHVSSSTRIARSVLFESTFDMVISYFRHSRADSTRVMRTDAAVPKFGTNERRDARGGWYDASGDISKYLSHLSYANFMNPQQIPLVAWVLATVWDMGGTGLLTDSQLRTVAAEAAWGADYLVRVQDEEGFFYINVFDGWSGDMSRRTLCAYERSSGLMTDQWHAALREGGGMSIAALARISTLPHSGDFPSERYLKSAERAYDHLKTHNLRYVDDGQENIIDDYTGLLAAAELFAVTRDEMYLEDARQWMTRLHHRLHPEGYFIANDGQRPFWHASDAGLPLVAVARYLQLESRTAHRKTAEEILHRHLAYLLRVTTEVPNPYGYARQSFLFRDKVQHGFFIPHVNETEYWWQGENARLASLAAAVVLGLKETEMSEERTTPLLRLASDQINWILGANPFGYCFLRGAGHLNPPDYASLPNYKEHGDLDGGIANGITGSGLDGSGIAFHDAPGFTPQGNDRWRWTEQWLPHAAWYLLAVTAMVNSSDIGDVGDVGSTADESLLSHRETDSVPIPETPENRANSAE